MHLSVQNNPASQPHRLLDLAGILSLENSLLLATVRLDCQDEPPTPSKDHQTRTPADTYLKLRDWEGKVSVFGPDMAAGILEVFNWYIL